MISDADLDELLKDINHEYPNDGEILTRGHLAARNVWVQRSRLRAEFITLTLSVQQNVDIFHNQMKCDILTDIRN